MNLLKMPRILALLLISPISFSIGNITNDVTLISRIKNAHGLRRQAITWVKMLKDDIKINAITMGDLITEDIPQDILDILQKNNDQPSKVYVLLDFLYQSKFVPKGGINIAYSMVDSTRISKSAVDILNKQFDLVVVPDNWLIEVYKKSGVTIPIFTLPIPLELDEFLSIPNKTTAHKIFTFGMFATYSERKNHKMVIDAFAKNFKNNPNVYLRIHGREELTKGFFNKLVKYVEQQELTNVILTEGFYPQKDLQTLLTDIDCYVYLSKGEGFSITPREAIAMGIPCILSNNTAHKIICDSGIVKQVKSEVLEPVFLWNTSMGENFNCTLEDAANALLDVYNNYQNYLTKAQDGRTWAMQYTPKNLKAKYLNLIKPNKIILGNQNIITEEYFMTNSTVLYEKYMSNYKLVG